jgi:hypothetical protein
MEEERGTPLSKEYKARSETQTSSEPLLQSTIIIPTSAAISLEIETNRYGVGKPRRVVIRAKISDEQSQD